MTWLFFAFSGPVLWAVSVHLDKYLVERYFKHTSVAALLLFTAFIGLALLPFIWWFQPETMKLPLPTTCLAGFSGVLYMAAAFFYLQALQSEEASVVAPFFQAAPLFAYVLAYAVLGEKLSSQQIFGGLLIVCGAALVSVRTAAPRTFKTRLVALMLACAFSAAVSSVIFKIAAVTADFWPATFWMYVGEAIFGLVVLAIGPYRKQTLTLLRSNPGTLLAINAANELINLAGSLGARYALLLAPLSLVQAVSSTTTLFVFLIGIALTLRYPTLGREDLSGGNVVRKGASAILIAIGVAIIDR
jgi:uncharacterized membrane protein